MNHSMCEGRYVTEFGCGCNKGKVANAVNSTARRVTMYEVHNTDGLVGEYTDLASARAKAVETSGRVKISTKTVEG